MDSSSQHPESEQQPQQPQPTRPSTALPPLHAHIPPSASLPLRTAPTTPVSTPGLFSPRQLPTTSISESNTPALAAGSPYLHPLQTHRVREYVAALPVLLPEHRGRVSPCHDWCRPHQASGASAATAIRISVSRVLTMCL